jgi:hypothetical protein
MIKGPASLNSFVKLKKTGDSADFHERTSKKLTFV